MVPTLQSLAQQAHSHSRGSAHFPHIMTIAYDGLGPRPSESFIHYALTEARSIDFHFPCFAASELARLLSKELRRFPSHVSFS